MRQMRGKAQTFGRSLEDAILEQMPGQSEIVLDELLSRFYVTQVPVDELRAQAEFQVNTIVIEIEQNRTEIEIARQKECQALEAETLRIKALKEQLRAAEAQRQEEQRRAREQSQAEECERIESAVRNTIGIMGIAEEELEIANAKFSEIVDAIRRNGLDRELNEEGGLTEQAETMIENIIRIEHKNRHQLQQPQQQRLDREKAAVVQAVAVPVDSVQAQAQRQDDVLILEGREFEEMVLQVINEMEMYEVMVLSPDVAYQNVDRMANALRRIASKYTDMSRDEFKIAVVYLMSIISDKQSGVPVVTDLEDVTAKEPDLERARKAGSIVTQMFMSKFNNMIRSARERREREEETKAKLKEMLVTARMMEAMEAAAAAAPIELGNNNSSQQLFAHNERTASAATATPSQAPAPGSNT
ncbi:MAG TPA: hypothetical protein VNC84_01100 [Gammaproteobacteria bacterium]|nr:hypothetical protein [Gammaproteobacteria bacterium]